MHRLIASTFDLVAITIALVAGAVIGVIAGLQHGGIRIEAVIIVLTVITLAIGSLAKLLQPAKVRAASNPPFIRR
jgi:ribose/xylose/arabinose/galactoside ABC-type transport system permease subunit